MTVPTIHLNGTSREALTSAIGEAATKIREAIGALAEAAPNARDYYPQGPGAFEAARAEHEDRQRRLASVYDELHALWAAIEDAGR